MRFRFILLAASCLFILFARGQSPAPALSQAFDRLEKDPQLAHGILALSVLDAQTGAVVFERNGQLGLPAASAQKVVTAATAFELLGRDFRYKTYFGYLGEQENGNLKGSLVVRGMGDPTLGSDRFESTRSSIIGRSLRMALDKQGIRSISGGVVGQLSNQEPYNLPRGWIWEDVGNYYGAGHGSLNWNENQFDIWLKPSEQIGQMITIRVNDKWRFGPIFSDIRGSGNGAAGLLVDAIDQSYPGSGASAGLFEFRNHITTGPAGSGDQAYVFYQPAAKGFIMTGTIPCCVDSFRIRGAIPDPNGFALGEIARITGARGNIRWGTLRNANNDFNARVLYVHQSPPLDSIIYWFLQKSINLYGEALVHTLAGEKNGFATAEDGLHMIRQFWKKQGIDTGSLNIVDGSGLSPANRVTAHALAQVMAYARRRPWYGAFYAALPVYHNLKMKSGTIGGVKAYAGYAKGRDGKDYAFAIIVNNFTGKTSEMNAKLYQLLDAL
jgi:D-alanyl-D-alanine carboxypeptidase/D-alanyl-D-alanine-endopeptidase (penicillin-binding protein 4)